MRPFHHIELGVNEQETIEIIANYSNKKLLELFVDLPIIRGPGVDPYMKLVNKEVRKRKLEKIRKSIQKSLSLHK